MTYPSLDSAFSRYKARALVAGESNSWIVQAVHQVPQRAEFRDLFQRLDDLLAAMSLEENGKVKARFDNIVPTDPQQWREEYDEQFREVLIELLGWESLRERYQGKAVGFYSRSSKKGVRTPDLGVWDDGILLAAMECKKLNRSEEEKAWFQAEGMKSGTLTLEPSLDPSSPLAKKLVATIQDAKGQLDSTHLSDNKFIFMSISLDTPVWTDPIKPIVQQFVREQADTLRSQGVELLAFEGFQPDRSFI